MRIPLAHTIGTRDETVTKDERMVNAFDEDGKVIKRPGTTSRYTLTASGGTKGQLLFCFQTPATSGAAATSTLIGIRGDVLTRPVT